MGANPPNAGLSKVPDIPSVEIRYNAYRVRITLFPFVNDSFIKMLGYKVFPHTRLFFFGWNRAPYIPDLE